MRKRRQNEPLELSQTRPLTLLFVLCGCILFAFCLMHIDKVGALLRKIVDALSPVLTGLVFAFLLSPAVSWAERHLLKLFAKQMEKHPKLKTTMRCVSAVGMLLLFLGAVVLLVSVTFSQVLDGISTFIRKIPSYIEFIRSEAGKFLESDSRLLDFVNSMSEQFSESEFDAADLTQKLITALTSGVSGLIGIVYNAVAGSIIALYVLISKERFGRQFKQVLYAVAKPKTAKWIHTQLTEAGRTISTAVLGKIIDSTIIGMLCFIGNTILRMPYTVLIAVIVGITNLIPYFGPICGAIVCDLIVLMENPVKAIYFLIFIIVLQQFDCNFLDPHIVGSSIGLPAFWELFACLLGGGLFGVPGLVVSIPLFAMAYRLIRQLVTDRLRERGRNGELEQDFLEETLNVPPDSPPQETAEKEPAAKLEEL